MKSFLHVGDHNSANSQHKVTLSALSSNHDNALNRAFAASLAFSMMSVLESLILIMLHIMCKSLDITNNS